MPVESDKERDRLIDCLPSYIGRPQGPAIDELIQPEMVAIIAGKGLREATQAAFPGEAGEGELGPQPVARVVGMMEIGLQQARRSTTIEPIDAIIAATGDVDDTKFLRQAGLGQQGSHVNGIGSICALSSPAVGHRPIRLP